MTDIVLAGVNITELKKQKELIKQEATEFISDGIEQVQALVAEIVEIVETAEREEEEVAQDTINAKAREAVEILGNVQLVSGVSGIEYYMPHHDEHGYKEGGTPMYYMLEDAGVEGKDVDALYGYLESMESQVRAWNTSTC